eukprot:11212502-Lingulodinium_polyedra.AAC.1
MRNKLFEKPDAPFMKLDWDKTVDRENMYTVRALLQALLLKNSSGIFDKVVLRRGLKAWDVELGALLTKLPNAIDTAAMTIAACMQMVRAASKNITTGARTPGWLQDLVKLLDADSAGDEVKHGMSTDCIEDSIVPAEPHDTEEVSKPSRQLMCPASSADSPVSGRRLLRRRTSVPSSDAASSEECCAPPPKKRSKPMPAAPKPPHTMDQDGTMFWYAKARVQAYRKRPGERAEEATMMQLDHHSGFIHFTWADGETWLSEEPALHQPDPDAHDEDGHEQDAHDQDEHDEEHGDQHKTKKPATFTPTTKKPATNAPTTKKPATFTPTTKKPATASIKKPSSSDWKLAHSRCYKEAEKRFVKMCMEKDEAVDDKQKKAYCTKMCRELKESWQAS